MAVRHWIVDASIHTHSRNRHSSTLHTPSCWRWQQVTSLHYARCLSWTNHNLYHSPSFNRRRPDIQASKQYEIEQHHLLTDFGRSFRREFQMLKEELFQKVKATKPMIFLTVTCTTSILTSFENMIGVTCNNSIHWFMYVISIVSL